MGIKTSPFLMAKVAHMLLLLLISQELKQRSFFLTSLAPAMLQWKDAQSKRRVQLKQRHFVVLVPRFLPRLRLISVVCVFLIQL